MMYLHENWSFSFFFSFFVCSGGPVYHLVSVSTFQLFGIHIFTSLSYSLTSIVNFFTKILYYLISNKSFGQTWCIWFFFVAEALFTIWFLFHIPTIWHPCLSWTPLLWPAELTHWCLKTHMSGWDIYAPLPGFTQQQFQLTGMRRNLSCSRYVLPKIITNLITFFL